MKRYILVIEERLSNYKDNMTLYLKLFPENESGIKNSIEEIELFLKRINEVRSIKEVEGYISVEFKDNQSMKLLDKHVIETVKDVLQNKSMVSYRVVNNMKFMEQLYESIDSECMINEINSLVSKVCKVSIDNSTPKVLFKVLQDGDELVWSFNDAELKEAIKICIKKNILVRGENNVNSSGNK